MKLPRLLTRKRDPFARQKIRYILNQPVHKRARVVRVSLSPLDDIRKNKQKPDDVIPLEKSKKFEVKKFETIENSKHEEREEEIIRLRWTSRLEKEAENIANILSKPDSKREDVLKLPKLVHANKRDIKYRLSRDVCEASRIINSLPVEKIFREHRDHGVTCSCTVCETINKIRIIPSPSPSESEVYILIVLISFLKLFFFM